jgi:phosphotransferase system HPr-like phosphotransfer protein
MGCAARRKRQIRVCNKEAAFESAAAAASLAIKQGHEIQISVPSAEDSGAASKAI